MKTIFKKTLRILTLLTALGTIILFVLAMFDDEPKTYILNVSAIEKYYEYQQRFINNNIQDLKFTKVSLLNKKIDSIVNDTTKYAKIYKKAIKDYGVSQGQTFSTVSVDKIKIDKNLIEKFKLNKSKHLTYDDIQAILDKNESSNLSLAFDDENFNSTLYSDANPNTNSFDYWKWILSLFFLTILLFPIRFFLTENDISETSKAIGKILEETDTNTNKIKPFWDTAQQTLELYYKRNLAQVNLIFNLSVIVMMMGFMLIVFGVSMMLIYPERKDLLGILTSASGIITEFIGATFIFLYKSTITQSLEYTKKLDKLTSVGVAIKILDTISEEKSYNPEKLNDSKIEIAKKLLDMNL